MIFVKFGDNHPYNKYLLLYKRRVVSDFINFEIIPEPCQNYSKIR